METVNTFFLCGLDQISLPMTTRRGEKFSDEFYVTRDHGKIVELVSRFDDALGRVERNYLLGRANAVIYRDARLECVSASESDVAAALTAQLIDDMLVVKGLDTALWLVKDNACHFDRAWIGGSVNGRTTVNNNVWASRHSCADGSFRTVAFTSDELRIARGSRRPLGLHLTAADAPTLLAKGSLRFQRFEYFVGIARASVDVAIKLAHYCSGLEALVSTSQQELSHQVSERVAAVLAPPGPERIAKFKLVKKAYGFRSKTVHGATFKASEVDQLRDCARDVDQVCRELQTIYFGGDPSFRAAVEGAADRTSDYFEHAVLGMGAGDEPLDGDVAS